MVARVIPATERADQDQLIRSVEALTPDERAKALLGLCVTLSTVIPDMVPILIAEARDALARNLITKADVKEEVEAFLKWWDSILRS